MRVKKGTHFIVLFFNRNLLLFQDEKLKRLVEIHGERWDFIANHFPDRADVQCQHRWHKVVNPELVKGKSSVATYLYSACRETESWRHNFCLVKKTYLNVISCSKYIW